MQEHQCEPRNVMNTIYLQSLDLGKNPKTSKGNASFRIHKLPIPIPQSLNIIILLVLWRTWHTAQEKSKYIPKRPIVLVYDQNIPKNCQYGVTGEGGEAKQCYNYIYSLP